MSSPSSETLVHELTHLIFGRALTSPYATSAPAWLNEGNASYWETGNRRDSLQRFRPIDRSGNVTEFAAMNAIPGLRKDIGNFYTQSTDFVGYLIENYGPDSIGKLLYELNSGKDIDTAMRAVYGGSLAQIENGWRNEWGLRSVSSPESPVDIQKDLPPTIPGLPTIKTGTLERLTENDSAQDPPVESRNSNHRTGTSCNASPTSHRRPPTNDQSNTRASHSHTEPHKRLLHRYCRRRMAGSQTQRHHRIRIARIRHHGPNVPKIQNLI